MTDYELEDAELAMRDAVCGWLKQAMLQPEPPRSESFTTSYGDVVLNLPPRPAPAESGNVDIVVYFVPYRRGYGVREYEEGTNGPKGWIPVARVSVPWRLGQDLQDTEQ